MRLIFEFFSTMIDVVYAHFFGGFVMTFAMRTQIGSLIRLHYLLSISVTFEIIYFKKMIRTIVPFNTFQITKICEINSIYTETLQPHSQWIVHVHIHTEHQSKNGERFLLIILLYVCVLAMVCVCKVRYADGILCFCLLFNTLFKS